MSSPKFVLTGNHPRAHSEAFPVHCEAVPAHNLLLKQARSTFGTCHVYTVKPVTNDHPLGPEKAVFSGRWSLVRGLYRITIMLCECETVRAWRSGL